MIDWLFHFLTDGLERGWFYFGHTWRFDLG